MQPINLCSFAILDLTAFTLWLTDEQVESKIAPIFLLISSPVCQIE
jgi:hypothetical protein